MSTPCLPEQYPAHIPASMKVRTVVTDTHLVQLHVSEDCVGVVRIEAATDAGVITLVLAGSHLKSLAARLADAVARDEAMPLTLGATA